MLLLSLGALAGTLLTAFDGLEGLEEYYWSYTEPRRDEEGNTGRKSQALR